MEVQQFGKLSSIWIEQKPTHAEGFYNEEKPDYKEWSLVYAKEMHHDEKFRKTILTLAGMVLSHGREEALLGMSRQQARKGG